MIGGAVYLMLVGVFALALGAIVRNTAGGIATFAGIFFVIPPLMNVLPDELEQRHQPVPAEQRRPSLFSLTHDAHSLSPLWGGLLFAGYCALALAMAAVLLVRRDT